MKKQLFPFLVLIVCLTHAVAQSEKYSKKNPSLSSFATPASPVAHSVQRTGNPSPMALSGFLTEGFENTTFPPAGWQSVSIQGPLTWKRNTAVKKSGLASAYMQWESQKGEDYLILPKFTVAAGDSVQFDLAVQYVGYEDTLLIVVSTTDSAIASFSDTIFIISDSIGYPNTPNVFQHYKASLGAYNGQSIYVAFNNSNNDGDGIYLDDVTLGTPFPDDVAAMSLDMKRNIGTTSQTAQGTVKNMGLNTETFLVSLDINGPGGSYSSSAPAALLAPNTSMQVSFLNWLPSIPGTYSVSLYTQLVGDDFTPNDTLTTTIEVYPEFLNYGWKDMPNMTAGKFGVGSAFFHTGTFPTDTNYIYETGGFDPSFALSTSSNDFSSVSNSWSAFSALPAARSQLTGQTVNGKIYFIGGYVSGFTPTAQNDIYDVASDTWSSGAAMPAAVGDYACGVYKDSLIYYIGGYNGSTDESAVNIYDTYLDTWSAGTAKTGTASAGLRCGIIGNNIVVVGGYSQTLPGNISEAILGTINPAAPGTITWTALPDYPGGPVSRQSGGSVYRDGQPLILFNGGSADGTGTSIVNETWAYDVVDATWKIGPGKNTGTNNLCHLLGGLANDSLYMISLGGYDGAAVSDNHEWLNLGPAPSTNGIGTPDVHANNVNVFPNPFTEAVTIGFTVEQNMRVEIRILDIQGKTLAVLCDKNIDAGNHAFRWNSENSPKGIYIARITMGDEVVNKKLIRK